MGMYGRWRRFDPALLESVRNNPQWGAIVGPSEEFDADKTWHGLHYLLTRHGFPVNLVFGESSLLDGYDPETSEPDPDWGLTPPGVLTPQQVQQAAAALASITPEDLIRGVDPADLSLEEVYPEPWDAERLKWAVELLPDIKDYFGAAAKSGDAVLCWIE